MATNVSRDKPRRPRVGLKHVAEKVGVSAMTVSLAMNGKGNLSSATRARVLAVAKRLNYRPNRLARAVQSGCSRTVGVMIPPFQYYHSHVIRGIHDVLAVNDSMPLLHFHFEGAVPGTGYDPAEPACLHRLLDQRVDGVIFWPSDDSVPDVYLRDAWDRGIPIVAVDRRLARTRADFSGTDDLEGGKLAVAHLLALGHRRIVHVAGDRRVATFVDRRAGAVQAARACADASLSIIECGIEDCRDRVMSVLGRARSRPTALFAASDHLAEQCYVAIDALGLQPGRDVSVVGFADLPEARWLRPTLTTLRQDFYEIGRNAARLVLDRISGKASRSSPRALRITPELIVRGSTAAPQATDALIPSPKRS